MCQENTPVLFNTKILQILFQKNTQATNQPKNSEKQ